MIKFKLYWPLDLLISLLNLSYGITFFEGKKNQETPQIIWEMCYSLADFSVYNFVFQVDIFISELFFFHTIFLGNLVGNFYFLLSILVFLISSSNISNVGFIFGTKFCLSFNIISLLKNHSDENLFFFFSMFFWHFLIMEDLNKENEA